MTTASHRDTPLRPLGVVSVFDAPSMLTLFVILLIAVPSRLVVGALGAAGTPAQLAGVACLMWWAAARVLGHFGRTPPLGLRTAIYVYAATVVASFVAAASRPLPAVEGRAADRGLLTTMALVGVALLACDSLRTAQQTVRLLRVVIWAVTAMAAVGVIQFFTGEDIARFIHIPGLEATVEFDSISRRSGLNRPSATALSPIEFGVVISMVLPIALHFALSQRIRNRVLRWLPVALMMVATFASVSRSAVVGLTIGTLVLVPSLQHGQRAKVAGVGALSLLAVYLLVPGLLGTMRNLFTRVGTDTSVQSRTDSYSLVVDYFLQRPLFGRGYGTFLPSYRILDNQYLNSLVSVGLVGLIAVLALLAGSFFTARSVRRRSPDPNIRMLAQSLAAALAVGASSFATFDSLSFPITAGMTFLLIGCTAALAKRSTSADARAEALWCSQ